MLRRALPLLLLALAALVALPAMPALADGDPASDVLLGESVFFPYSPAVSAPLQRTLTAETAAAKKAGLPLKVALISSPVDLGVVPDLFGHPQKYADFLDQEISFTGHGQPLLVVMAAGYGLRGLNPKATSALASVAAPRGTGSDALARAAVRAVSRLAQAEGVPLRGVRGLPGGGKGGGGSSVVLVVVLAVLAGLIAGALAAVTLRRRRTEAPEGP